MNVHDAFVLHAQQHILLFQFWHVQTWGRSTRCMMHYLINAINFIRHVTFVCNSVICITIINIIIVFIVNRTNIITYTWLTLINCLANTIYYNRLFIVLSLLCVRCVFNFCFSYHHSTRIHVLSFLRITLVCCVCFGCLSIIAMFSNAWASHFSIILCILSWNKRSRTFCQLFQLLH